VLSRIFLLQILFYGLTGLGNAFLNSRRRFFAAAWSPVVSNLVIVVSLLSLRDRTWELADVLTDGRLKWTLGLGATGRIAAVAVLVPGSGAPPGHRSPPPVPVPTQAVVWRAKSVCHPSGGSGSHQPAVQM